MTSKKTIRHTLGPTLKQLDKKRVVVYARVSRESELKHQSIEAQKENLKAEITSRPDWEFIDFYVDEGVTGTKLDRPEFNRMMQDARGGKIDIILTKTVSRFGRNVASVLKVIQELTELKVIVIFDNENISTADKDALLYLQFLSIQAEAEARQTSDYQKWAIRSRYKEGIPNHCRPYGYVMVNHQLQVIPKEAEVVKRIFSMYLSGMGGQAIAKRLNADGLTTKRNEKWLPKTIYEIIRNEVYVGDLLLQKYYVDNFLTKKKLRNRGDLPMYLVSDAHEPIIERSTFSKVQDEIKRRQSIYDSKNTPVSDYPRLFSQLIRCGHCGNSITYKYKSSNGTKRKLWICRTHEKLGSIHCPVKFIREEILKNITYEVLLEKSLINPETTLTNELLKTHIQVIISHENQELEYRLKNGETIIKKWEFVSRSKSWTPEMKQKARERAIAQCAKRKEEKHG